MNQETRWKGVVFDFDGTLLDSTQEGLSRFIQIAINLDLEVNDDMIAIVKRMWGSPGHVLVSTCWPHVSREIFMREWETFDSINSIALFPGVADTLAVLAQHISLSVLTARSWSTHAQMRFHGIREHFRFVCTLDDSPMPKPHPESIRPLLEQYRKYSIELNELVLVGDSVRTDYALACALGIDFIGLTWGSNSCNDFLAAGVDEKCIIDTIKDLSRMIFLSPA